MGELSERERSSFLKKRSKKLLAVSLHRVPDTPETDVTEQVKVFWFFFSKKNILPYCGFQRPRNAAPRTSTQIASTTTRARAIASAITTSVAGVGPLVNIMRMAGIMGTS
jgi:hypothetical protein